MRPHPALLLPISCVFRQDTARPEVDGKEGSVFPKAASEMNCLREVPMLLFHGLNPWE